jgi:hypothetical protein
VVDKLKPYAKGLVAVAAAGLMAVQTQIPLSPTWHGWVSVGLAMLGAVGVYAVPNKPAQS